MSASFNCIYPNSVLPLCQNQSISRWFCSVRSGSHPHPSVCFWCQMKHKDQDIIFSAAAAYSSQKLQCWCLHWTVPNTGATPSLQLTIVETERMWSERNDWAMPAKIVQHWIIKSCCAGPGQSPCPSINRLWWCSKRDLGTLSVSVNIQNIN